MEEPRFLHRRPEHGYTSRTFQAASAEPEAVSASEQERQTELAHRRAAFIRREVWMQLRGAFEPLLAETRAAFGPQVANELRGMRRELDRLDAKLR